MDKPIYFSFKKTPGGSYWNLQLPLRFPSGVQTLWSKVFVLEMSRMESDIFLWSITENLILKESSIITCRIIGLFLRIDIQMQVQHLTEVLALTWVRPPQEAEPEATSWRTDLLCFSSRERTRHPEHCVFCYSPREVCSGFIHPQKQHSCSPDGWRDIHEENWSLQSYCNVQWKQLGNQAVGLYVLCKNNRL